MPSLLRIGAAAVLSAGLALWPTPAPAFDSVVGNPPEIGWELMVGALSDGELSAGDLVEPAFQSFWSAASQVITKTQICREAYANFLARGNNAAFTFHGNMTVVNAGGDERVTYRQPVRVLPQPNGTLVVALLKADGNPAKIWRCGGDNAADDDGDRPQAPTIEALGGATAFNFDLPEGRVSVYLPSDLVAGDTISGTVVAAPNGDTAEQRQANAARLQGYVVDVGGAELRVPGVDFYPQFEFVVGPVGDAFFTIALSNSDRELGAVAIQAARNATALSTIGAPSMVQVGDAVTVPGAFDGAAANTRASMGDVDCPVIAESPRQATFLSPTDQTGPLPVRVRDGGYATNETSGDHVTYEGVVRSVGVSLSMPRTTLARGERARVTLNVTGLSFRPTPRAEVEVRIEISASPTISLAGGNEQTIAINPRAVNRAGVFSENLDIRVRERGEFEITATLVRPWRPPYRFMPVSDIFIPTPSIRVYRDE